MSDQEIVDEYRTGETDSVADRPRSRSREVSHSSSRASSRRSRERKDRDRSRSHSPRHRRRSSRSTQRSRDDDNHRRSRNSSRARSPGRRRYRDDRDKPEVNRCLGVFGLGTYTQERELREVFETYGAIEDVHVVYDPQSRQSRGFAFIYFENTDDAREAKEQCDGIDIDGKKIRVDYSITKRPHSPTPGMYMGRRNSSRYGDRHNRRYGGHDSRDDYRDRLSSPYYNRRRYSRSRS